MDKNKKLIDLLHYSKSIDNSHNQENIELAIKVLEQLDSEFTMTMKKANGHILLKTVNESGLEFSVNICNNHVDIYYESKDKSYAYDYTKRNILSRIYQIYQFYI